MSHHDCILAIDLGTSAFKAAPVSASGLIAEPVVVPYELDRAAGRITCPPERYFGAAMQALQQAAASAREAGCRVSAIGISSQAQTFLALDRAGEPLADAVVWLDDRATNEAERVSRALPPAPTHCGFRRFTGQQFLPKVIHLLEHGEIPGASVGKFLLLNEYLVYRLTGTVYGDETTQGMGGFFDIAARAWSPVALDFAGISAEHLAPTAPAAARSAILAPEICHDLAIEPVPVYLCGNDQTCAAAGVDLNEPGSILCNFGTAMVVYMRRDDLPGEILETQIAGIDPLTSRYFLLGLEAECGNLVEWLARRVYPGEGIEHLLRKAVQSEFWPACREFPQPMPSLTSGGLSRFQASFEQAASVSRPALLARTFLEVLRATFLQILTEVRGSAPTPGRLIASGGLSRSQAWLDFLEQKTSIPFVHAPSEHPGLIGIARIITRNRNSSPA